MPIGARTRYRLDHASLRKSGAGNPCENDRPRVLGINLQNLFAGAACAGIF